MLVLDMLDILTPMAMLAIPMPLLDMLPTAHLPAPTLLVLPPLLSQPLLVDMLVLVAMLLTLPELFMLPSVKLRLMLIPLFSMELMDMLVLDMLDILTPMAMLAIPMPLLDMLPTAHLPAPTLLVLPPLLSQPLLVDMPVLVAMLPTLPELFMLLKNFKISNCFLCLLDPI